MIIICMLVTQLQDSELNQLFHHFFLFFQDNMGTDQGKASVSLCGYGH